MTLSQTANLTKKIITLSIILLILITASFSGYKIWHAYYIAHLPPIEELPDNKFAKLPYPDFPKSSDISSNFTYSLDTSTGNLPKQGIDPGFEKIVKVYYIPKSYISLLSPEKSKSLAEKFTITSDAEILTETKYSFSENQKTLTVDLETGNFLYKKEATISAKETLEEDEKLVSGFKTILNSLGILTDDLKNGRNKVVLLKNTGDELVPTTVRGEAQAAQISLWVEDIDQKNILTSNFNKSLVSATITKSATDLENYLNLEFTNYPIDKSTFATYQIKTAEAAFEDLKNGRGVIILKPAKPQVSISSVYLGYFLADNYNSYLEPIYVFEGQNFVSYVPAITDDFLNQTK